MKYETHGGERATAIVGSLNANSRVLTRVERAHSRTSIWKLKPVFTQLFFFLFFFLRYYNILVEEKKKKKIK